MALKDENPPRNDGSTDGILDNMTIRRKLIVIIMIISSSAVLLAGATTAVYQHHMFRRQMVKDFSTHVRMIADNCLAALAFDAPGDAAKILDSLKAKPSVAYACVYGKDGSVFAAYRRSDFTGEPRGAPGPERCRFTADWLVASHPIVMNKEVLGRVFIQSDLTELEASLKKSVMVIAVIVIVVLIMAFAMSSRMQRVISAPVSHLVEIASAVTENKDYSVRAVKRGRDEFGVLNDSFNTMLENIEERDLALQESEVRYRGVFENTGAATCIINEECVITMCNSMFEKLCGFSKSEIEHIMYWHDLVTHDEKMRLGDYSKQRMERTGTPPDEYECDFVDRIGRRKQIHVMISFIPGGENRVVSVLDITERVRAGEELKRHRDHLGEMVRERTSELAKANRELQREIARRGESEEMFSKAFHSGGALMAVSTLQSGRFIEVNNRFLETFGYERDEVIGKTSKEIGLFVDYGRRVDMLATLRAKGAMRDVEILFRSKNGEVRRGSVAADILQVEDQERLLTVMVDITERTLAEEALKKAKDAAEASGRAKSEYLAGMSHEITGSLNEILRCGEMLSALVTDEKPQAYLDHITTSSKSLLTLINNILALSRIEVGMIRIMREPVDLVTIFKEIEQRFAKNIVDRGLRFLMNIDKEPPSMLLLDETRIKQVLDNLVGNALKFTGKGFITLSAEKRAKTKDRSRIDLILSVKDTGVGIPGKDLGNVFDAYKRRRGQGPEQAGGLGLGLVISKKLVEMMGGRIAVSSELSVGTTFEITLRDIRAASTNGLAPDGKSFGSECFSFNNAKIMVVDDVKSNRSLLKKILTDVEADVLTAENGEEAVQLAEKHLPDAIIMDIVMPVMDGIEATRLLKKGSKTKDIPVIALTAAAKVNHMERMPEIGLDGYLLKPVQKDELFGELARNLRKAED